ncbi:Tetratricopeptide repeat protein [Aquisphaera giovannonii]|uniref:Tetratricopeptide repeat protein n=1 Tax=Aquisphaera giovannonii TaxID=406548 RepID=A0A5B9W9I9_9BACT|nr:tetratricopeptide repeat protein [Aquisphaera giovannonii]QEH36741.1 Tetratricopeptide repeat protein [Aquisphaera giovannonii]
MSEARRGAEFGRPRVLLGVDSNCMSLLIMAFICFFSASEAITVGEAEQPLKLDPFAYLDHTFVDEMECHGEAERELGLLLRMYEKPGQEGSRAAIFGNLAYYCGKKQKYLEAESFFNQALEICDKHPFARRQADEAMLILGLSECCIRKGDFATAERLAKQALSRRERDMGPKAYETILCQISLANVYIQQRRGNEAVALLQPVIDIAARDRMDAGRAVTLIKVYGRALAEVGRMVESRQAESRARKLELESIKNRVEELERQRTKVEEKSKETIRYMREHPDPSLRAEVETLILAEAERPMIHSRRLLKVMRRYVTLLRNDDQEVEASRQEARIGELTRFLSR